MSKLINKTQIKQFEEMEKEWLQEETAYDEYWEKRFQDEADFWDWMELRFDQTAESFLRLTGLGGQFFTKVKDVLREAAMTGYFFGELRWQDDLKTLIDSAFEEAEKDNE